MTMLIIKGTTFFLKKHTLGLSKFWVVLGTWIGETNGKRYPLLE